MRYLELLAEATLRLSPPDDWVGAADIIVVIDPTRAQIAAMVPQQGSLRGLTDGSRVFVWRGRSATHPEVLRRLVAHGEWEGSINAHGAPDYQGWMCFLIRNELAPFHAMEHEWQTEQRKAIVPLGDHLALYVAGTDASKTLAVPVIAAWARANGGQSAP